MTETSVLVILYAHARPLTINEISKAYGRTSGACSYDYKIVRSMLASGKIRLVETEEKQHKYLPTDPHPPEFEP